MLPMLCMLVALITNALAVVPTLTCTLPLATGMAIRLRPLTIAEPLSWLVPCSVKVPPTGLVNTTESALAVNVESPRVIVLPLK